ncbi:MAG TPA: hypothetical protein VH595_00945 [Verrucomicrobiae bacterium]|jgi:hypothetical protein|nr:hypothetical protein [Verrucomicrobiae bacterium]
MDTQQLVFFDDLPSNFKETLVKEFGDYSVALAYMKDGKATGFYPTGSGVLVRRENRFGILTARHCIHKPGPEIGLGPSGKDTLLLILRDGRGIQVKAHEVFEHHLANPHSLEFGPDLTFIEIVAGDRLDTFKAISSFWSLNQNPNEIYTAFGKVGTPIARIGFPGLDYQTTIDGNSIEHTVRHMAYFFVIQKGDVFERAGWDYIESTCWYGGAEKLPGTFKGVSGGPVWGMQLSKDEETGQFCLVKSALIGINFYETGIQNDEQRLRGHFIKSIYEVAWRDLN